MIKWGKKCLARFNIRIFLFCFVFNYKMYLEKQTKGQLMPYSVYYSTATLTEKNGKDLTAMVNCKLLMLTFLRVLFTIFTTVIV